MAKRGQMRHVSRRAAIYARFSSHNQRDESIEIQVENCRAYCEANGLEVVQVYSDYAQTGRDTNRAGYQRMLKDADRHLFDFVVIYKVTRIMRNRDEMALLRMQLARDRVEILYAGETIADGSSGVLQLGMLEVLAEWESAILAERVRDGIRKNAERCMANGHKLFGWDIGPDGLYVINEREAEALRECRRIIMCGGSVADAVRFMEPYRSKRGRPITQQALTVMLTRPQNYGTYQYAGVVVEGGMPALWSRLEQERLEDMMASGTKPRRGTDQASFVLTGKLCHEHGDGTLHGMRGTSGTGRRKVTYWYYQCRDCRRTLPKQEAEHAVADAVRELLAVPETRERIADMVCDEEVWADDGPSQSEVIAAELADISRAFDNIWKAIEAGIAPPGGKERVDALKERQALLERELREAKAIEGMRLERDRVLKWLEDAAEHSDDQLIGLFVSRVVWREDGTFHVACLFDEIEPPSPKEEAERFGYESNGRAGLNQLETCRLRFYVVRHGFVVVTTAPRRTRRGGCTA